MLFPQSVASLLLVSVALFGVISCAPPPQPVSTEPAPPTISALSDAPKAPAPTSTENTDADTQTEKTDIISDLIAEIEDAPKDAPAAEDALNPPSAPTSSQDNDTALAPAASDEQVSDVAAADFAADNQTVGDELSDELAGEEQMALPPHQSSLLCSKKRWMLLLRCWLRAGLIRIQR